MRTISPGPAANSGTAANTFEANRATDPEASGKLKSTVDDSNAAAQMAANAYEKRAAEAGGVQH